jgi:serine/threonine-protein kinase TTK/MPS1
METIGKGGSSKVFKVLDKHLRCFALKKVCLKDADKTVAQAFINEIEILRKLKGSPNIINFVDAETNLNLGYIHLVFFS